MKYHSKKTVIDGITFDSRKEAERYSELKLLERCGAISNLELQKVYELIPAQYELYERYGKNGNRLKDGKKCIEKSCVYKADFVYIDNETGQQVVEDVKGYKGGQAYSLFSIKRKLMLERYGIKVEEV